MSALYKSKDPLVCALLRIVEGQVRSASLDHPEWGITDKAARSIAKRVAGNIASDWARLSALSGTSLRSNAVAETCNLESASLADGVGDGPAPSAAPELLVPVECVA